MTPGLIRLQDRLWLRLAVVAAFGVVSITAIHVAVGQRIASRALESEQGALGRKIATLVAYDLAEPLLLDDIGAARDIVAGVASTEGVEYCFVTQGAAVVVSSLAETPTSLVAARKGEKRGAQVLEVDGRPVLDLAAPVLGGSLGVVRVGISTAAVVKARADLTRDLAWLAVAIIVMGGAASFIMGRRMARPVSSILAAVEQFDPTKDEPLPPIRAAGTDEIGELGARVTAMMHRLRAAHVEAERARERSFAAERLAAIGALTAGVAHEVNNPLAGLMNCVRRLERADLSPEKEQVYLTHMRSSVQRIATTIQRLLDFTRPRSVALVPTDVVRVARDALDLVAPLLVDREIEYALDTNGVSGTVLADSHQVAQALLNVLVNAAHVTERGGTIRVRLRQRNSLYGIAVEDEGPGIPADIRDRVLDAFFTTKPPGQGTGLGLAMTRAIVAAHGGDLTFDFPATGGTVVTIWLRSALPRATPLPRDDQSSPIVS